ncbi:MAG: adenylate/guanylate cyclase domain-containing protein [Aeromicrobium sp.]|uniref:adenylate/guanylate cyclase domain-containing protein n=1 Tax=Aeromicrobium sp. TaxID=1871063 RepID=UPI0039E30ABF
MEPTRADRLAAYVRRMSIVWWLRAVLIGGLILTSAVGGVAVYFLATVVIPLPVEPGQSLAMRNLALALTLVPILVAVGTVWGLAMTAGLADWVRQDRPPTDEEKIDLLAVPRRLFWMHAVLWSLGTAVFAAFNATVSPVLALTVTQIIGLAGATTSSIVYLLTERVVRPLARRALATGVPTRSRVRTVAGRTMFAWVLGTGVLLWGSAAVGLATLIRSDDVTVRQVSITMLVLGSIGFVVGGFTTYAAARATSDPVRGLRLALTRVGGGDLDVRIPIDDGTEVGMLQAGFNEMVTGLRERERLRDLFGRHVGDDVARAALAEGVSLGGEARHVSVLFVDVIGSTTLAVERDPEEVVSLLNRFFQVVIDEVQAQGGSINKFEGDAALAIWNAPLPIDGFEARALTAARRMARRLAGEVPGLEAGVGVSSGRAVAGNVGAAQRYEYTVIGDPVNEAARLTDHAKTVPGRVVVNAAMLDRAGPEADHWVEIEPFLARGRQAPTRVARVTGDD